MCHISCLKERLDKIQFTIGHITFEILTWGISIILLPLLTYNSHQWYYGGKPFVWWLSNMDL
jgi:hypothetical protein